MLLPILIGTVAVALAVAAAVLFLRARARESTSASPSALAADSLGEMRAIGQRIETLVSQQQLQGETARQHLAQKLDAVGEGISQQQTHLSGLQNELRHEVHRRDAEMDEIRTQLASIQHATVLGSASAPLSLPPAEAASPPAEAAPFGAPARPDLTDDASFVDEEPTFIAEAPQMETELYSGDGLAASFDEMPFADGWDTGETPDTEALTLDAPEAIPPPPFSDPFAFVDPFAAPTDAAPQTQTVPTEDVPTEAAPVSDFEPFDFQPPAESVGTDDDGFDSLFEDVSFGSTPGAPGEALMPLPAPVVAPAPQPTHLPPTDSAWVARSAQPVPGAPVPPQDAPAVLVTPPSVAPSPVFAPPAFAPPVQDAPAVPVAAPAAPMVAAPDGADTLTVISTIDETIQAALYTAGVVTLDEIARWGRADARRIATLASVSEDTIMNQWIFEAQAALFQSFSTRK